MLRPASLAAALLLVASAPVAQADDAGLFDSHFAKVAGGTPCYARSYDDAHLKAHPKQQVKRIEIDMTRANPDGVVNTAENFDLGVGVQVTRSADWYTGAAICKQAGDAIDCFLEGDGGRFRLTADKDGALKLEAGDYGLAFEGAKDFLELKDSDDHVFIVAPSDRSACDAATADVKRTQPDE